jgi:hypothetical protein
MFEYIEKKVRGFRILAAVSLIVLCFGLVPAVNAGFAPSPFRDDLGKLGAVSNNLASINDNPFEYYRDDIGHDEVSLNLWMI